MYLYQRGRPCLTAGRAVLYNADKRRATQSALLNRGSDRTQIPATVAGEQSGRLSTCHNDGENPTPPEGLSNSHSLPPGQEPPKMHPLKRSPSRFTTGGGGLKPGRSTDDSRTKTAKSSHRGGGEGKPFFYRHTINSGSQEDHTE